MNRRKKINSILKARNKRAKAKIAGNQKPKYISKADRAAAELGETTTTEVSDSSNPNAENSDK